jgi:hypothetical protein
VLGVCSSSSSSSVLERNRRLSIHMCSYR